jgi:hypothetical protein
MNTLTERQMMPRLVEQTSDREKELMELLVMAYADLICQPGASQAVIAKLEIEVKNWLNP